MSYDFCFIFIICWELQIEFINIYNKTKWIITYLKSEYFIIKYSNFNLFDINKTKLRIIYQNNLIQIKKNLFLFLKFVIQKKN